MIRFGSVIGSDGIVFETDSKTLKLEKFPYYDKVTAEADTETYSNCSLASGSLSDTNIETRTRVENLCHVVNNVHSGKNIEFSEYTIISRNTVTGDTCFL